LGKVCLLDYGSIKPKKYSNFQVFLGLHYCQ